jgi:hypothetical protein
VIDGHFTETKELIVGFWLWHVRSMEEAIEWVKRCLSSHEGEAEIEVRQVFEAVDFGSELTRSRSCGTPPPCTGRKEVTEPVDFMGPRSTLQ